MCYYVKESGDIETIVSSDGKLVNKIPLKVLEKEQERRNEVILHDHRGVFVSVKEFKEKYGGFY